MKLGKLLATGNTATIYVHENEVMKVFKENFSETEAHYEANKQRAVFSYGLPVPNVYDVTTIDAKPVIKMEYVEGKTLGELFFENMEKAEEYLNVSISIQQKIHQVEATLHEQMSEKLQRQIENAELLNDTQKYNLLKRLEKMPSTNKLCHGDFHLHNLIVSHDQISIIDWVDSSAGDIRADVYRTYLLYSQFSLDFANMYMNLYCSSSGLLKEEILQWAPIIAGARLSENVTTEDNARLLEIVNNLEM